MKTHFATFGLEEQTAWMMIWDTSLKDQVIKVNSKDEINVGDKIYAGENKMGNGVMYVINEVIESRPSTLSGLTYFTLQAERTITQPEKQTK